MKLQNFTALLCRSLLDFVFPPHCCVCESYLEEDEHVVCKGCWGGMELIDRGFCRRCGAPLAESVSPCQWCQKREFNFSGVRILSIFVGKTQDIIHQFKYSGKKSIGRRLGGMLAELLRDDDRMIKADMIVPVPLHRSRKRERGYNQSQIIAQSLGDALKIEVREDILTRWKWTKVQTKLDPIQRIENVDGAFRVVKAEDLKDKKVVLVDDVLTTGATANSCANTLTEGGAKSVFVAVAARPFDIR